jgi:recombination associated protein RdgC
MFKQAIIYKLTGGTDLGYSGLLSTKLSTHAFVACGATQDKSVGWIPPREENGAFVESVGGQWIAKLAIETKSVPSSEVNKLIEEQVKAIEEATGRKPGKKEKRELKEEALFSLLPKAFPKLKHVLVWIDPVKCTLVINAGSQSTADDVISALLHAAEGLSISLVQTTTSPQASMTQWLLSDHLDIPGAFAIERECVLKSTGEDAATVKFSKHNLDNAEVRKHVTEGKLPTQLAMSWDGKASFTLTENFQLKKIEFLDGVLDASGTDRNEDRFDSDVALSTGILAPLISELIEALGGEMEFTAESEQAESSAPIDGELYDKAVEIVMGEQKASISLIQRHLKIGYNAAARLLEQMETNGLVSPMQPSGQRNILASA